MATATLKLKRDLGQRYVVRTKGYPRWGWHAVGWTDNYDEAKVMQRQFACEHGCIETSIVDRGPPTD